MCPTRIEISHVFSAEVGNKDMKGRNFSIVSMRFEFLAPLKYFRQLHSAIERNKYVVGAISLQYFPHFLNTVWATASIYWFSGYNSQSL